MPSGKSEFGLTAGIARGGISSTRVASPTRDLLQDEGIASWKGQPPYSGSSHEGPAAAVGHKMHGSPQGNYGWPTHLLADTNLGLESKPLKEALELQPRSKEGSTTPPTCGGGQAGLDHSLRLENGGLCANTVQLPLQGLNGSGKGISKRRSRASRRVQTMVLHTTSKDFRETVQRLTGLPVATRFAKGRELLGAHIVRPQPKRANLETKELVSKSCPSYPSSLNGTNPQKFQFHANSHSVAVQQQEAHAAVPVPPVTTSRAPQGSILNFDKHQSKLGDIHTTANYFSRSNNDGAKIMASLYEALARSSDRSTAVAAAAAAMTTSSTASMPVTTDSVPPTARKFTIPSSQMEELKSTTAGGGGGGGGSIVRTPKLDTDLLSGSWDARTLYE